MKTKKNPNGRPPKYSDDVKLSEKAKEYFDICDQAKQLPEKAGLCFYLGISRDTYSEYRKKFPDAIKRIDLFIESRWVQRLNGQSPVGAIFYLKNAFKENYRDKNETDITSGGEKLTITGMQIKKE